MKQQVINFTIPNGSKGFKTNQEKLLGKPVQMQVFKTAISNTGLVNLSVLDASGTPISRPQNIENYRSREAGYTANKPFEAVANSSIAIEVSADNAFSADVQVQVVIDYIEQC